MFHRHPSWEIIRHFFPVPHWPAMFDLTVIQDGWRVSRMRGGYEIDFTLDKSIMTTAVIVGAIIWLPTLMFLYVIDFGHIFAGGEFIAALAALLAFAVPAGLSFTRGGNGTALTWVAATAPLLMIIGSITDLLVMSIIFGNMSSPVNEIASAAIATAGWACLGLVIYLVNLHACENRT